MLFKSIFMTNFLAEISKPTKKEFNLHIITFYKLFTNLKTKNFILISIFCWLILFVWQIRCLFTSFSFLKFAGWSISSIDKTAEDLYNQFSRLRSENRTETTDAMTLAYLIKQVLDAPPITVQHGKLSRIWRSKLELVRDSWLPSRVRILIFKETVIIESHPHPKYYLFGAPNHVFYTAWIYRNAFQWTLEPVDEARRFRIKDGRNNHYITAVGDEESYSWRRPILMIRADTIGAADEWRIELHGPDGFTIQSAAYDEYLYASKFLGRYKGSLWDVYTWRDKRDGKFPECVWTLR